MHLSGEQLAAVTDAVIRIWRKHHGPGPEGGKSFLNDNLLVTVLHGGMTPQERTLAARGRADVVRQVRVTFEELLREDFGRVIKEITGYTLRGYQSQVLVDAGVTVELFLLGGDEQLS